MKELKKPTEKQRNALIREGYDFNIQMYEHFGETQQIGEVGNISNDYYKLGNLKLKTGDKWVEVLNTDNFTIQIKKIN